VIPRGLPRGVSFLHLHSSRPFLRPFMDRMPGCFIRSPWGKAADEARLQDILAAGDCINHAVLTASEIWRGIVIPLPPVMCRFTMRRIISPAGPKRFGAGPAGSEKRFYKIPGARENLLRIAATAPGNTSDRIPPWPYPETTGPCSNGRTPNRRRGLRRGRPRVRIDPPPAAASRFPLPTNAGSFQQFPAGAV
jgi:hypothetical protein